MYPAILGKSFEIRGMDKVAVAASLVPRTNTLFPKRSKQWETPWSLPTPTFSKMSLIQMCRYWSTFGLPGADLVE